MQNILVVSGHTDLNNSVANKAILERLENKLPQAEFVYLDKLYSDFQIDVEAEQEKLLNADIIVLQFPIFWYAMPSLLSRWLEETFQHGFSHGSTGDKLKGKKLIASFAMLSISLVIPSTLRINLAFLFVCGLSSYNPSISLTSTTISALTAGTTSDANVSLSPTLISSTAKVSFSLIIGTTSYSINACIALLKFINRLRSSKSS